MFRFHMEPDPDPDRMFDPDRMRIIELILAVPDVNPNIDGPLHVAASFNSSRIVRMLLAHPNINPNYLVQGRTAFFTACIEPSYRTIRTLIEDERVDPNIECEYNGVFETALHAAAREGHVPVVKILLEYPSRIDPRITNNAGETAETIACNIYLAELEGESSDESSDEDAFFGGVTLQERAHDIWKLLFSRRLERELRHQRRQRIQRRHERLWLGRITRNRFDQNQPMPEDIVGEVTDHIGHEHDRLLYRQYVLNM